MNSDMQIILCGAACLPGIGIAGWYFASDIRNRADRGRRHASTPRAATQSRPWRALGAAICGLVGPMSFAGVLMLDWRSAPRIFIGFWALILVLLLWLCGLALVDLARTRRQLRDVRAARRQLLTEVCKDAHKNTDRSES